MTTIDVAVFSTQDASDVEAIAHFDGAKQVPEGAVIVGNWRTLGAPPAPSAKLRQSGGVLYWADPRTLTELKTAKSTEINAARLNANQSGFMFDSRRIATDLLSMTDIQFVNGSVALNDVLPERWPGAWKADDNSYVPIPDVATWKLFYAALVAAGSANFATSQALKVALAAATTAEQVATVVWPA